MHVHVHTFPHAAAVSKPLVQEDLSLERCHGISSPFHTAFFGCVAITESPILAGSGLLATQWLLSVCYMLIAVAKLPVGGG